MARGDRGRSVNRLVVLVARTGHQADPVGSLAPAADRLRAAGHHVRTAVLESGRPTVTDVLTAARADGVGEVVLVPAHLPPDRYLVAWLRRVVAHWLQAASGPPQVRLAAALTSAGALAEEILAAVQGPTAPLGTTAAPLTVPAWERVPAYRHHVLVCRGPRCSALGAGGVAQTLADDLDRRSMGEDEVLVTSTGCLFPCARGPVLVIHPDDVWYGRMTAERILRVVGEHLVADRPVPAWQEPRGGP
jgi:(2Fe-2S) ferredoxin